MFIITSLQEIVLFLSERKPRDRWRKRVVAKVKMIHESPRRKNRGQGIAGTRSLGTGVELVDFT